MDKENIYCIAQLFAAATAIDIAYQQLEKIPTHNVLVIKLEIGKKIRELRELQERVILEATNIDNEGYNKKK